MKLCVSQQDTEVVPGCNQLRHLMNQPDEGPLSMSMGLFLPDLLPHTAAAGKALPPALVQGLSKAQRFIFYQR